MNGTVDVIIPVFDREASLDDLLKSIKNQTVRASKIIIVFAEGAEDADRREKLEKERGITLLFSGSEFSGVIYNTALKQCTADEVFFIEAGAVPMRNDVIELLQKDLEDEKTAASFGHLVSDYSIPGRYRAEQGYFYQDESRDYRFENIYALGMRTFLHRNACALYKNELLKKACFENVCLSHTEYLWCADQIYRGFNIHYNADARVNYNIKAGLGLHFRLSFELGALQTMYPQILGLSVNMVKKIKDEQVALMNMAMEDVYKKQHDHALRVLRGNADFLSAVPLWFSLRLKCLGFFLGRYYHRLPKSWYRRFSEHKSYWTGI